jgi:2-octaprenyl-6-methoxyphenol hydroxylase
MTDFEAAVIGAGPAGLAAALALARMGVETALVAPPHDPARAAQDQRTTALIGASIQLMKNLGVWDCRAPGVGGRGSGVAETPTADARHPTAAVSDPEGLTPFAAPIAAVRIADDRGGLVRAPEILFRAAEIGLASFGANLPNPALLGALTEAAARAPGLARVETAGVVGIAPQAGSVRLALAEGGSVEAALAVAADGRASQAPAAAGIAVSAWDYPQAAVVASFAHSRPHAATVNELHRRAGPLTTVPLQGLRSALVWVEEPGEARRLAALAEAGFAAELEERLQGVLGRIGQVGPRAVHALAGRRAERMAAARIALVGEAAHVVPPIGAQGLNLGLRDAAELADCAGGAKARGEDIGGEVVLAAYDSARRRDVLARSLSIDILNRSLLTDLLPVEALRGLAAHAIAGFAPLRRALMQEGAGLAGPLPSLMR